MSLAQITINIWFESIQFPLREFPPKPMDIQIGEIGGNWLVEVIGVVLPKACLGFGFEKGEKTWRI